MTQKTPLHHLGRFFKLFVIGSLVVSRSASGGIPTEDAVRHELAWLSVRDGLSGSEANVQLPADVKRLVQQGDGRDFENRVRATYRTISPGEVAHLDALWMNSFSERGTDPDTVDRFLNARSAVLPELVAEKSSEMTSPEKWVEFVREFKRASYPEA